MNLYNVVDNEFLETLISERLDKYLNDKKQEQLDKYLNDKKKEQNIEEPKINFITGEEYVKETEHQAEIENLRKENKMLKYIIEAYERRFRAVASMFSLDEVDVIRLRQHVISKYCNLNHINQE